MNSWKNFTLLALLFSGSISFAKTTLVGISGVSNQFLSSDGVTYYAFGGYNGAIGGCAAGSVSTTSTCDSCSAGGLIDCNHNSIHSSLRFHVNLHSDNTQLPAGTVVFAKVTSGSGGSLNGTAALSPGGDYYFDIAWSDLATAIGTSVGGADASGTLQVGLAADSSGTSPVSGETFSIRVNYAYATGFSTHTKCDPDAGASGGTNDGFCFVDILAGDNKVYATRTNVASTFPAASSSASDVKWSGLVFFYESGPYTDTSGDATMLGNITSSSPNSVISYDNANSPPTFDPRISGLDNDSRYCFLMANQDTAGNIRNYTKTGDYSAQDASALLCAHPDQVLGLLDDKKCFIATAAWGSSLNPHVSTLRLFRDQFLKTNSWGRSFVKFYYDLSPDLAQYISYHDNLRAVARVGLWPLVGFANLSLALGLSGAIAVLLFALIAGAGGVLLVRRRSRKDS